MANEQNGLYDVQANTFAVGRLSDPGRSGKNNEDYYGLFTHSGVTRDGTQPVYVAVVADGIGGSASGEEASRLAVMTVQEFFNANPVDPEKVFEQMRTAIRRANARIYEIALNNPSMRGMGTTIVLAVTIGDQLHLAHAGDSRAYLLRNERLHLLTLDHTWAQEAVDAGRISPEEALRHPNKNVIKRFLGPLESVDVDTSYIDPERSRGDVRVRGNRDMVESQPLTLQSGDTLLLCSDGLNDELSDERIQRILLGGPPHQSVRELVAQANEAGGRDNITAIVLHKPEAGAPPPPPPPPATALRTSSDATVPMTLAGAGGAAVEGNRGWRARMGNVLYTLAALLILIALVWVLASQGIVKIPGISPADNNSSETGTATAIAGSSAGPATSPAVAAAPVADTPTATATPSAIPTQTPDEEPGRTTASEVAAVDTSTPTATSSHTPSPTAVATETPSPTVAPTDTPTFAPTLTPTLIPAARPTGPTSTPTPLRIGGDATHTPTSTRTRQPTSTPFTTPTDTPTHTRTPLPTRTQTPTHTATPIGGATNPTATPTASPSPGSPPGGGTLTKPPGANANPQEPAEGALLNSGGNTAFVWETGYEPPPGHKFEFLIWPAVAGSGGWRQGRSPIGAGGESCSTVENSTRTSCRANVDLVEWQDNRNSGGFAPGRHYWGVAVVRVNPSYQPQFLLSSAGRLFEYQRPASAPPFTGGDDRP